VLLGEGVGVGEGVGGGVGAGGSGAGLFEVQKFFKQLPLRHSELALQ
jgi:hypothetical protein